MVLTGATASVISSLKSTVEVAQLNAKKRNKMQQKRVAFYDL